MKNNDCNTNNISFNRRKFLEYFAAIGISSSVSPSLINKQDTAGEITTETIKAAETIGVKIEEEKAEIYRDIHANVDKVLMPILHALAFDVTKKQRKYVVSHKNLGLPIK